MNWRAFIPRTDLSEFLKTESLLDSWYVLSNDDLTVLVDATKLRVLKLFTHGCFGTLQDLVYDVYPEERSNGMWGLVPIYWQGEERYLPFRHVGGDFIYPKPEQVDFKPEEDRIALHDISCFNAAGGDAGKLDFEVQLSGHEVRMDVIAPANANRTGVWTTWYPLYNYFRPADSPEDLDIEYYTIGFRGTYSPHFNESVGSDITLVDSFGRMPSLRLRCDVGSLRLESRCAPEFGNAFQLHVSAETEGTRQGLTLSVGKNPVTAFMRPHIPAHTPERVELAAPSRPKVTVDGKEVSARPFGEGRYIVEMVCPPGYHELRAVCQEGRTVREFCAHDDPSQKIVAMGDAISRLGWQRKGIENLLPYDAKLDGPAPALRDGMSYIAHSVRVIPALVTATLVSGNHKYVDRAWENLEAIASRAATTPGGALFSPLIRDMKGDVPEKYRGACRPSDAGILVRGWLYTARVYNAIGQFKLAEECLLKGLRFAEVLLEMQEEDGGFSARYWYHDLKPNPTAEGRGTVNPWILQIWEIAEACSGMEPERTARLKALCQKYFDFVSDPQTGGFKSTLGGENRNYLYVATGPATLTFLIKYLASGDVRILNFARQSMKIIALMTMHYIDQPHNFFYSNVGNLGVFRNQPNLFGQGGMLDLETIEPAIALSRYIDDKLAEAVAQYTFWDRMTGTVQEDGTVRGCFITVPNYRYEKTDTSHPLNYGAVGVGAYYLITHAQ